jgi:hypothetical protein
MPQRASAHNRKDAKRLVLALEREVIKMKPMGA